MNAPPPAAAWGPYRLQALLADPRSRVVLPPETLATLPDLRGGRARAERSALLLTDAQHDRRRSAPVAGAAVVAGSEAGVGGILGWIALAYRVELGAHPLGGRCEIPSRLLAWLTDRELLFRTLAAVPGGVPHQLRRTVAGEDELLLDEGRFARRIRLLDGSDTAVASWLIAGTGDPVAELPAALQGALTRLAAIVSRIERRARLVTEPLPPSRLAVGASMVRLDAPEWFALFPTAALQRLVAWFAGGADDTTGPEPAPGGGVGAIGGGAASAQRAAALRLIDALTRHDGLLHLVATVPRVARTRRSRHALRTVIRLLEAGGAVRRTFLESAYRSGEHFAALAQILRWCGTATRESVRSTMRRSRFEQLEDRSRSAVAAGRPPWEALAEAAELLVGGLDAQARGAGGGLIQPVARILAEHYRAPRGDQLRRAWRADIETGRLGSLLDRAPATRRRLLLDHMPRRLLVRACCGERGEVQRIVARGYSHRGRALFLEDVRTLERQVERGELASLDELLSARATLQRALARLIEGLGRTSRR